MIQNMLQYEPLVSCHSHLPLIGQGDASPKNSLLTPHVVDALHSYKFLQRQFQYVRARVSSQSPTLVMRQFVLVTFLRSSPSVSW